MASKQYYKVINPRGHYGLVYKLGENVDPNPVALNKIRSCGAGAIYFTDKENLKEFSWHGTMIAWVTPLSPVKMDEEGDKWKAHKINITKMLPIKDAIPLIWKTSKERYNAYMRFSVDISSDLLNQFSTEMQCALIFEKDNTTAKRRKFLQANSGNKKLIAFLTKIVTGRRYPAHYDDDFIKIWLIENGVSLFKFTGTALAELWKYNRKFRKLLQEKVSEETVKYFAKMANENY